MFFCCKLGGECGLEERHGRPCIWAVWCMHELLGAAMATCRLCTPYRDCPGVATKSQWLKFCARSSRARTTLKVSEEVAPTTRKVDSETSTPQIADSRITTTAAPVNL